MSKLRDVGLREAVNASDATDTLIAALIACGCPYATASCVAVHLVDASLCGVESHGVMRVLQYVQQFNDRIMDPQAIPIAQVMATGGEEIDGRGGIGIPAMHLGIEQAGNRAADHGMAVIAIRHAGHTGRLGAFADIAAEQGLLTITLGGGNRHVWRQVAPYGGRKARLPTNPYCIGIPGGQRGPVTLDFATSIIAGGWIYAARSAGARLPAGAMMDRDGVPTTNPQDFFDGGAILPAGGAKGYGLALMAELVGEAMLGPAITECNWLMVAVDTRRFRAPSKIAEVAEEILSDVRDCPPLPGFDRVEIPGQREREHKQKSGSVIQVPAATWQRILALPH